MMTFMELLSSITGRKDLVMIQSFPDPIVEVVQVKDLDFDTEYDNPIYDSIMDDYDSMYDDEE